MQYIHALPPFLTTWHKLKAIIWPITYWLRKRTVIYKDGSYISQHCLRNAESYYVIYNSPESVNLFSSDYYYCYLCSCFCLVYFLWFRIKLLLCLQWKVMIETDKDKKLGQDCLKMAWYLYSILVFTTIALCPVGMLYL